MRLPRLFRTTPFRLTLLFLALFAAAASLFLAYIYVATAGEVSNRADARVTREIASLEAVYKRGGFTALNQEVIERTTSDRPLLYLLMSRAGAPISGSIARSPMPHFGGTRDWASFTLTETEMDGMVVKRPARGLEERLSGGEILFVGADVSESEAFVNKILHALWGAGALIVVLGLAGGVFAGPNKSVMRAPCQANTSARKCRACRNIPSRRQATSL